MGNESRAQGGRRQKRWSRTKPPRVRAFGIPLLALCVVGGASDPAFAHRDDYLNETFVFETLEAGEFEPEVFVDSGWRTGGGDSFRAYALGFEYGLTHRWMIDGFAGWRDPAGGKLFFQRFRTEGRHRFGEEGDRSVDVAVSFEAEYEREEEASEPAVGPMSEESAWIFKPRLILSRDLPQGFNLTLNLDLGGEVRSHRLDRWTPRYALAARYPEESTLRYGVEFRQDFGEERSTLLVPQVWLALPREATFKLGTGLDVDGTRKQGTLCEAGLRD